MVAVTKHYQKIFHVSWLCNLSSCNLLFLPAWIKKTVTDVIGKIMVEVAQIAERQIERITYLIEN